MNPRVSDSEVLAISSDLLKKKTNFFFGGGGVYFGFYSNWLINREFIQQTLSER